MRFFLMSQGSFNPKIRFLGQKVCSVACVQTHTQTHTKVTTEGTLSGFQDFFLQPIIKDRPNNCYGSVINVGVEDCSIMLNLQSSIVGSFQWPPKWNT